MVVTFVTSNCTLQADLFGVIDQFQQNFSSKLKGKISLGKIAEI